MDYTTAKNYILTKPEVGLDYPFGPEVAVFKIKNKMFALLGKSGEHDSMNLKCDPDEALALRDIFEAVIPGYHMNKKHWNTIIFDGTVPKAEIDRMIDRSYGLVIKGLTRKERQSLELSYGPDKLYR